MYIYADISDKQVWTREATDEHEDCIRRVKWGINQRIICIKMKIHVMFSDDVNKGKGV